MNTSAGTSIKKIFLLTMINIKIMMFGGNSEGKKSSTAKKVLMIIGISVLAIYVIGIFGVMAGAFSIGMYGGLKMVGMQSLLLGLTSGIMGYVVLFFALFYIISIFYYAKDIEMLLSLPLKGSEIIASKFLTVLLCEYITTIIAFIPFGYYGIMENSGILYFIYMIIVVLFLPIIPLCIASILIMLVMKFVKFARNKDLFMVVSSIMIFVVAMGFGMFFGGSSKNGLDFNTLAANEGLTKMVDKLFPGVGFSANALAESNSIMGFLYLLLFVGICIGLFALTMFLGNILYLKSAALVNSSATRKKKLKDADLTFKKSPVWLKLIRKDFTVIFKTPMFLMNNLFIVIIMPIALALPLITGGPEAINEILKFIDVTSPTFINIAIFVATALGFFFSSMSSISATAITREGSSVVLMKIMPVPYKVQILSKCAVSAIVGEVVIVLILVVLAIMFKISIAITFLLLLVSTLANIISSMLFIFFDLRKPKLHWNSEQEAVKQSMNAFFSVILGMALAGGCIALAVASIMLPSIIVVPIVVVALLALTIGSYILISKISVTYMNKISY